MFDKKSRQDVAQETFSAYVVRGERPAIRKDHAGDTQCVYRNEDGDKCAFGRFIPDNQYSRHMEQHSVTEVIRGVRVYADNEYDEPLYTANLTYLFESNVYEDEPNGSNFFTLIQQAHDLPAIHKADLTQFRIGVAEKLAEVVDEFGLAPLEWR